MSILQEIQQNIKDGKCTLILDTDDNMNMIISPYTVDGFLGGTAILATQWEDTIIHALESDYVKLINEEYITDLSENLMVLASFIHPKIEGKMEYYKALTTN